MSNPIIPKTNAAPGTSAPSSLLLGEIATNRSTGKLYIGADSGVVEVVGSGSATSFAQLSGTLQTQQLCALTGDVTASTGTASLQIAALQGNPVSAATPSNGQVLQWNGTTWVPGTVSGGGSGGGGLLYYLNFATDADAPTTGLPQTPVVPHQLGRVAETAQTSVTSGSLTVGQYDLICGFVSESTPIDPNVSYWPAGIWDFNIWCAGTANAGAQTVLQLRIYKYDGTTPTLIATSGDAVVANNGTAVQTAVSLVIPQTDVEVTDRLYIEVRAKASGNNHTVTISFGDSTPSHVHTTLSSVGGSGLVKVIDGTFQSPASLLVDADVSASAAIAQSKISGLVADLAAKVATSNIIALTNGGTGATSAAGALTALGAQAALTTAAPLAIELGGTAVNNLTSARNAFAPYGVIYVAGRNSNTLNGTVSNYVFTASANGALPTADGYTFQVGDLMLNITSIAGSTANLGPWIVTSVGSASTPVVLTRPSWFRGTINAIGFYFFIVGGQNVQGSLHTIRVTTMSATVTTSTILQNTGDPSVTLFSSLGTLLNQSGASMSGTLVFRANATTSTAARFQAGSLQTIASAHAMEWDGQRMYLTNITTQRYAVAYTNDIPALTTVAAAALGATASAGTSTQPARADHVHPLPLGASTPAALANTASAGTSTEAARADHVHAFPLPAINSTALTAFTLALTDNNATVQTTAATSVSISIPLASSVAFPVGAQILIYQAGAGQVTVAGVSGVTLRSSGGKTKTGAQYALATLLKVAANEWVLGGDITT